MKINLFRDKKDAIKIYRDIYFVRKLPVKRQLFVAACGQFLHYSEQKYAFFFLAERAEITLQKLKRHGCSVTVLIFFHRRRSSALTKKCSHYRRERL